jgi:4'-phosphopantetheinyl transferase EntD
MLARSTGTPVAVALATVEELPATAQELPDAEYVASRMAAQRAIRGIVGDRGTIEVHRRQNRAPVAHLLHDDSSRRNIALSLTHRDGRAAAIAAPAGSRIGIDLEHVEAIDPARQRFFLTEHERRSVGQVATAALWTLKEATWKALRLGSSVGFHELELEIRESGDVERVHFRGQSWRAVTALSSPWPGYVLATVQLGSGR